MMITWFSSPSTHGTLCDWGQGVELLKVFNLWDGVFSYILLKDKHIKHFKTSEQKIDSNWSAASKLADREKLQGAVQNKRLYRQKEVGIMKLYWAKKQLVFARWLIMRGWQGSARQVTQLLLVVRFLIDKFKVLLLGETRLWLSCDLVIWGLT